MLFPFIALSPLLLNNMRGCDPVKAGTCLTAQQRTAPMSEPKLSVLLPEAAEGEPEMLR